MRSSEAITTAQRAGDAEDDHRHRADRHPDHVGGAAADRVGEPAGERREHRLDRGAADEADRDQRVAAAEESIRSGSSTSIAPNISEGEPTKSAASSRRRSTMQRRTSRSGWLSRTACRGSGRR